MPTHVDNELSGAVIGAAIKVHREFGPGLDEPIYQEALSLQLLADGINHHPEWPLPLHYKGTHLDCGYRPDIFIPQRLVVELKSVEAIHPIHEAQLLVQPLAVETVTELHSARLLGRLRQAKLARGLLLNFNSLTLGDGLRRIINPNRPR